MLIINIKENESIDKALKRFKKKFEKAQAEKAKQISSKIIKFNLFSDIGN